MSYCHVKNDLDNGNNMYRNLYKGTAKNCAATRHLIFIWRGSSFKLIWQPILIWIFCYAILSVIYRNVLFDIPRGKEMFELMCIYAERFSSLVPITFITGFYVSQVVTRWWDQFMSLPWPDHLALKIVCLIPGMVIIISI